MRALTFLVLILTGFAFADEPQTKIKELDEITGCWKKVIFSDQAMNAMNKFYVYDQTLQKFQWYCFYSDGAFRTMTSKNDLDVSTSDIEKLYEPYPIVMHFELVSPGNILISHDQDSSQLNMWKVLRLNVDIPLQTGEVIEEGSILMGLLDESAQGFVHLRVLQEIE